MVESMASSSNPAMERAIARRWMSYYLYITRKKHWYDSTGPEISPNEWRRLVEGNEELNWAPELGEYFAIWPDASRQDPPWLTWSNGNLESRNPDQATIMKFVSLANALGAIVVGEENERYAADGRIAALPRPCPLERVQSWWFNLRSSLSHLPQPDPLPFHVGSQVQDARGRLATVTRIDLTANSGLGNITIRHEDGRTSCVSAVAHGLSLPGSIPGDT